MKTKTNIFLSLLMCAVTFVVLVTSVFAWFSSVRESKATVQTITADDGNYELTLKYFRGNYIGVNNNEIQGYEKEDVNTAVTYNYTDTFLSLTDLNTKLEGLSFDPVNYVENQLIMSDLYPMIRFTFALEIQSNYQYDTAIAFTLNKFSCGYVTNKQIVPAYEKGVDGAADREIYLSEAINIYCQAYNLDAGATLSSDEIKSFLQKGEADDKFKKGDNTKYQTNGFDTGDYCALSDDDTLKVKANKGSTYVILFTFEFSNDASHNYKFGGYFPEVPTTENPATKRYFVATPNDKNGSLNVFQNMTFNVENLRITRKDPQQTA